MVAQKPAWLEALYVQRFFSSCSIHEAAKKNEKNICCLDCCLSICPHCVLSHRSHRLLQIRRYVYHEVVRLEDLEKLIDCSNIQAYTINAAKVVFIKKRPQNRQFKGSGNYCTSCDRSLQEPFFHCSLGCKVDYLINHYNDISPFLRVCKILQLGPDFFIPQEITNVGEDETTRSTVVDTSDDFEPLSSSSGSDNNNTNDDSNHINTFSCSTEFVRKKRSGIYVYGRFNITNKTTNMAEEDVATSLMSRRKGVPRRSPLS